MTNIHGSSLFYVFVAFPADGTKIPDCFVVPSGIVADLLRETHSAWLMKPGKNGTPHKDGDMRVLKTDYSGEGREANHGASWLEPYRKTGVNYGNSEPNRMLNLTMSITCFWMLNLDIIFSRYFVIARG